MWNRCSSTKAKKKKSLTQNNTKVDKGRLTRKGGAPAGRRKKPLQGAGSLLFHGGSRVSKKEDCASILWLPHVFPVKEKQLKRDRIHFRSHFKVQSIMMGKSQQWELGSHSSRVPPPSKPEPERDGYMLLFSSFLHLHSLGPSASGMNRPTLRMTCSTSIHYS